MRRGAAFLLALGLCGCQPGREASEPPVRYQGDTLAAVQFSSDQGIIDACSGVAHEAGVSVIACYKDARLYMPNPCTWPGSDPYAQLMCHEMGHWNSWPANHPK